MRHAAQATWDYKVKVFPWIVFSQITLKFRPPLTVEHVWSAAKISDTVEGYGADVSTPRPALRRAMPPAARVQLTTTSLSRSVDDNEPLALHRRLCR